ncbi:HK97 gp10 family phage protein [bacterium]|nr:HK97 gp10 family phage protein [bacterium]
MSVTFEDFRVQCKDAIGDAAIAFLYEAGGELASQTARNSRVKTGQTKGSWDYIVDESELIATVGSPLENAIWEEFGTGEYALNDNGRKGGWYYVDEKGNGHFTHGKTPNRALFNAYTTLKPAIIAAAESKLKGMG